MADGMERRGAAAERPEVEAGIRLLEAWIETQREYRGLPGMSLGVVCDQELVWARGFGLADVEAGRRATPETVYRIASISKLFTATAVMQLRDAGQVRLDEPVSTYLPWFRLKQPSDAEPITLRHLLTHTGGVPREAAFPYWTEPEFPTRGQVMETVGSQEAAYPPDTKWKYSNLGITLAGEIVSAVSGMPFPEYLQRHVFDPLGMESTAVGVPERLRERLATGYGRRMPDGTRALRPFMDCRAIDPAGGLASTVEDLARFASLQIRDGAAGGRQILKGSTLREMHRVHWLSPDWKSGWGLGFAVKHTPERILVRHGGWLAGYQSEFSVSPAEKVGVIVLTNADDARPYAGLPDSLADRVYRWVVPPLVKAMAPAPEARTADPAWQRYVGRYRSPWGDTQVLILDGKLAAITPTEQDPTTTQLTLVPEGEHTFRSRSEGPMVEDGDRVVFELGTDGKAARVKWGENHKERLID